MIKTHELASALTALAHILRKLPNQRLEDLELSAPRSRVDPSTIPVALSTLVSLSDIDKSQWALFIREHGFPIEVRARDASRDVIGKLLRFLESNPDARKKLSATSRTRSATSPELMRALDLLLKP
jgi:hypothetical protein